MPETFSQHVIVGAGGAIAHALVPELVRQNENVTLVSRRGTTLPGVTAIAADATDYASLQTAIPEGSAVYLLVGLPYRRDVWRTTWPLLMENIIRVCSEKHAFLAFFDNVYMYGPVDGPMTEDTPHRPTSEKGRVREGVVNTLLDAFNSGTVRGVVARSADFYGPGADGNGIPNMLVLQRMRAGKAAQWIADADQPHSLTYTTDCGRALPLLVADKTAHNRVWHLPTAHPPISIRRMARIAAEILEISPRTQTMPAWMLRIGGLFDRTIRELPEMAYQYDRPYLFDSTAFEQHFAFTPTSYEQGIRETIVSMHTAAT